MGHRLREDRLGCNPSYHRNMRTYTRARIPGTTYFFTVNLAERHGSDLLTRHINALREAFRVTKQAHPFAIEAMVVLPEHLLALPVALAAGRQRFSDALAFDQGLFLSHAPAWRTRHLAAALLGTCNSGRTRFASPYRLHPLQSVKHGHVVRAIDWPYSSFHRFLARGDYPADWAASLDVLDFASGE